jgi:hypothetical protein
MATPNDTPAPTKPLMAGCRQEPCSPKLRCKLCHKGVSDEEAAGNVDDLRWKCSRATDESLGKIKALAEHPSDLAVINHELIRRMTRRSLGVDPIYFLER